MATKKKKIVKKVRPVARRKVSVGKKVKIVRASKPAVPVLKPVGVVTHFFAHIKVAIVKFKQPTRVGAQVGFRGATTKFDQKISSLQFDHKPITIAPKGKEVGLKVAKRVREGDEVFLVS